MSVLDTAIMQIKGYVQELEESNRIIKQNLTDLFNEEEFQKLPSYQAFKLAYYSFTENMNISSTTGTTKGNTNSTSTALQIDPLHAPKFIRDKKTESNNSISKTKINITAKGIKPTITPNPQDKKDVSNQITTNQSNQSINTNNTNSPIEYLPVTPLPDEIVRKIELNGITYYLHAGRLYNYQTCHEVSLLSDQEITKTVPVYKVQSQIGFIHSNGDLYQILDDKAHIAICCGTYALDEFGKDDIGMFA